VSNDSKYIILGGDSMFYVYDIENEHILDVNLFLPEGHSFGHSTHLGA